MNEMSSAVQEISQTTQGAAVDARKAEETRTPAARLCNRQCRRLRFY